MHGKGVPALIKATTQITDSDPGMFKRLRKLMHDIENAYVSVGVHEDAGSYPGTNAPTVVEVALWTEFGTRSQPERSWLRSAVDENMGLIDRWREEVLEQIWEEKITVAQGLEIIGFRMQVLVQNKIKSNVPPPNAESTLAEKRRDGVGDGTLIHSGLLMRSVTFKVVA